MAEKTFRCRLITPEANVLDAPVPYASVPMWDGQRGFMNQTSAMVGNLGFGELRLDLAQGGSKTWFVDGGFMQNVENTLTILASGALTPDQLDRSEIQAELAEANARKSEDPAQMDRISEDRQRAMAKLMMAGR